MPRCLPEDTDEEHESNVPIIDTFLQSNEAESILKMTSFTVKEIRRLVEKCSQFLYKK